MQATDDYQGEPRILELPVNEPPLFSYVCPVNKNYRLKATENA